MVKKGVFISIFIVLTVLIVISQFNLYSPNVLMDNSYTLVNAANTFFEGSIQIHGDCNLATWNSPVRMRSASPERMLSPTHLRPLAPAVTRLLSTYPFRAPSPDVTRIRSPTPLRQLSTSIARSISPSNPQKRSSYPTRQLSPATEQTVSASPTRQSHLHQLEPFLPHPSDHIPLILVNHFKNKSI